MNLLPIFLVGLMGSVHCIGMCGGIVGALSSAAPAHPAPAPALAPALASQAANPLPRIIPIRIAGSAQVQAFGQDLVRVLGYNLGRLSSYALAGALAGGIAAGLLRGADVLGWLAPAQTLAYVITNLVLVLLGLYLTQWWTGMSRMEQLGSGLWARLRPHAARLVPVDTPAKALLLGSLWGWLPCGMVYSALLTALMAGSAVQGALTMLAFGAGTLPVLLVAGLSGARLRQLAARPVVRRVAGVIVLAFGILGLLRAAEIGGLGIARGWIDVFCVSPVHGV
ncbi:cytochrome biogenesis protein [Herbaspirillum rubrisubalbicans]|uniref:Cytochrome biogenesis protein n=1 Tax=Herbaspirillum rubrisubalbicans TaxID=80842 RepID=A0ABX9BUX1_9BURK|nr:MULTISPECIES: sulfite exporter TauE/SafE family protein [Herbaspirillum]NQE47884.1 cytochrome biogenesis protein [Herbaspirillum rubrisubalbicans]RAM61388.1 cytochrome biogenesis protein [Herbaspirillum rubrisubalbicans]RAN44229.1 cytochrome biogenesis protein [Herbaspirillum rubrisubalbicans]